MAKTQLNLELSYKGKVLDYIKSGSGIFKDKWFLGSNKHLLWQILIPSFPDKLQLISQKNNNFVMKLVPNATLDCKINGKPVDKNYLSANGLLRGDELVLNSEMTGTLQLNPDWEVHYRFIEPYVYVLTEEQRQIVAQYSRRAEKTPEEKMGRGLILLFIFITLAFLVIYDLALKPDGQDAGNLEASLAQLQRKAQRVEIPDRPQTGDTEDDAAARAAAEAAAKAAAAAAAQAGKAQTGRPGGVAGGTGGGSASSLFGDFKPGNVVRNPVAITGQREFVAATRGGGGGGGGGTGPGPGGGGPGGGGGASGGGMASSFDPNAVSGYTQSQFSSASNVNVSGGGAAPSGPVTVKGNVSQAEIAALGRPIAITSTERAAISRITSKAPAVTENSIASAPPEAQSDMQALRSAVNSRKGQLQTLYRKAAAVESSGGTVTIKIYGTGSRIEAAEVTPTSGNLPKSFLEDLKQAVQSWSVSGVSGAFNYSFTMRFGS